MSGHSKWDNIKHRKGKQDKKRAKLFGRLSRQIRTAVKEGSSGDPEQNPTLRTYLDKAKDANMPKDNIQRAIDRGLGKGKTGALKEMTYEGFGPGGVGILITAVTDNFNRISAELKNVFSEFGGNLGAPGSVSYMFARSEASDEGEGYICTMPIPVEDEATQDKLEELMSELRENDDVEEVFCAGQWPEGEGV